ncbi:porin [Janthinobacterium fluminis]|uniref:Porin n=1 Tax=Janthinobacterium fluminis TaxID=2987524 RepID=A0ABT5K3J9_9BURK|nr:porin [Janthinobacterium fluminis]MDC8759040.1 porin [Janthinobacterium fluminis]
MKKSLLALAVLASFAGAASAQSSVTVYGVLDAGVTREMGGAAGSVTKLATGVQSGNRLGFKGTEDLGGGLKANFQIENGFDLDTGKTRQGDRLFGRQAFVGLSGAFGAVNLGRQYNPIFISIDSIDPFGTGLPGRIDNLMVAGNYRTDNAVTYSTPTVSGFTANLMYGAGENKTGRTLGLSADYNNGPLVLTIAYDKLNAFTSGVTTTGGSKALLVGGTYNFGPATAHAAYETDKNDVTGSNFRDYMLGVTVPVSAAGSVMASFVKKSDRTKNDMGSKQFGIGYTYSLSKRTNVYTSYARITNEANAVGTVGDASSGGDGSTPALGKASSAVTVGIRHKF